MAEEENSPPLPPINGNGVRKRHDLVLGLSLGSCVTFSSLLAAACLFHPPSDWNLVSKVIDHLDALSLLLAGGLLGLSKPGQ